MSLCKVNAGVPAPALASSSHTTALNRKSSTPPPPNSSGMLNPITPCLPAARNTSRSTMPLASQASAFGVTSRARNSRTTSRNCSCSGPKTVRRICFPYSSSRMVALAWPPPSHMVCNP
jgi:hypothetical protein